MKTAIILLALALTGCANLTHHSDDAVKTPAGIYCGTRDASKAVVQIFTSMPEWHSGCSSEAQYAHAICLLLSPVIIIDWPLEVVMDTVTFPYDLYKEITE